MTPDRLRELAHAVERTLLGETTDPECMLNILAPVVATVCLTAAHAALARAGRPLDEAAIHAAARSAAAAFAEGVHAYLADEPAPPGFSGNVN